jgi:predicted phosphodiesterase
MRVAALYDIHGNLPALEAVLAELDTLGCERIVAGGDMALGPSPAEVLQALERLGDRVAFVRGNCDRDMATVLHREPRPEHPWEDRLRWAAEQISAEQRDLLGGLPLSLTLEVDGLGPTLFCHGTPRSDDEIVTRISPDSRFAGSLAGVSERVLVSGHTHVQFDRAVLGRRWINAGSVGMPYEDRPGAFWALLGPDVEFRCTPYDYERAGERIRATGFPRVEEFARSLFVTPMSPEAASQQFEQWAEDRARARR